MKNWLIIKWYDFLVFIGIRLSDDWILLKAIEKIESKNTAKKIFTLAAIIKIKFGTVNNQKTINKINEFVKNETQQIRT